MIFRSYIGSGGELVCASAEAGGRGASSPSTVRSPGPLSSPDSAALAAALAPPLAVLRLDLSLCAVGPAGVRAIARRLPPGLVELALVLCDGGPAMAAIDTGGCAAAVAEQMPAGLKVGTDTDTGGSAGRRGTAASCCGPLVCPLCCRLLGATP